MTDSKLFTDEEFLEFNRLIQKMKHFCDKCGGCQLDGQNCPLKECGCDNLYHPNFDSLEVYLWAEYCRITNGEEE